MDKKKLNEEQALLSEYTPAIAQAITTAINEHMGGNFRFALLVYSHAGERLGFTLVIFTDGRASYVSNADRQESITQLEKLLDSWKNGMPDIPAHEFN